MLQPKAVALEIMDQKAAAFGFSCEAGNQCAYFYVETAGLKLAKMYVTGDKAKLKRISVIRGEVNFTLKEI